MEYNLSGLPEKITANGKEEILSWNALGKLAKIQSPKNSQKQFSYTNRGFLQTAGDENFEFDFGKPGVGIRTASNKIKISPEGIDPFEKVISETVEKNEIATAYDLMGQVIANGSKQLEWDFWGRLLKVSDKNLSWEASYDGLGRGIQTRSSGWVSTTVTNSFYDPEEEFEEIGIATQGKTFWKIFGPDGCDAVEDEKGSVAYLVQNGLKHLSEIVTSEKVIHCEEISPYGPQGKPILEPDLVRYAKSLNWHSQSQDPTGFIYLGARYYDPESGRFLSPDPVSYPVALDLYAYASGDPINNVDLDGRFDSPVYKTLGSTFVSMFNPGREAFNAIRSTYNGISSWCYHHGITNSHFAEVGSWDPLNGEIEYINGISNSIDNSRNPMSMLSQMGNGVKIHGIYNASFGANLPPLTSDGPFSGLVRNFLNKSVDISEQILGACGFQSPPTQLLKERWNNFIKTHGPDAKILLICHSGGTTFAHQALETSPESVRQRITVLPLAPATIIPRKLCYRSYNYASEGDLVPYLNFPHYLKYHSELHVLKRHPDAKWFDHEVMSPTFNKPTTRIIKEFIKISGGKK